MDQKPKRTIAVLHEDKILLECPFCGTTLIRTDYEKIQKLLDYEGMPRGKVCTKCNGVAVLKLNSQDREAIRAKISARSPSDEFPPTEKIEEPTQRIEPTEEIEPTRKIEDV